MTDTGYIRNTTLRTLQERGSDEGATRTLPCALCARLLEQRADKNSKPYFVCEPCGTQFFIRGAAGREHLEELLRAPKPVSAYGVGSNATDHIAQAALRNDLMQMQSYIETFCAEQTVIPLKPFTPENAVSFPEWSGQLCDRISRALNRQKLQGADDR